MTKQKWTIETNSAYPSLYDVYDDVYDGNQIALHKIEEVARLIAAAPELLEALNTILNHFPGYTLDWLVENLEGADGIVQAVEDARSAIAKARGE